MAKFTTGKPEMGGGKSPILEAGDYPFEVDDTKWKKAKSSGNWMIELKLKIEESFVWEFLVFSPAAFWKFDQFLKAIGQHPGEGIDVDIQEDDGDVTLTVNDAVWDIDELIGRTGNLTLKVGKNDKGEPRNEVVGFIWEEF